MEATIEALKKALLEAAGQTEMPLSELAEMDRMQWIRTFRFIDTEEMETLTLQFKDLISKYCEGQSEAAQASLSDILEQKEMWKNDLLRQAPESYSELEKTLR